MNERKKQAPLAALLGDGLLLLCALTGLTGSFLSLYGGAAMEGAAWPATPLDLCAAREGEFLALAALLALASLYVWSLSRFRWGLAGALGALWGLAAFLNQERVFHGAGITVRTVTEVFSRRVSWGRVFPYDAGLTPPEEGAAARLFLIIALMLLALILGWAVARARRWWIAVLFTLPPLLPGLLADLYPRWPAFLALAACWCVMLLTDLCKWAAPDRRGSLTLTALPCVAAVLAVITLAFPREGYARPDWARRMEAGLFDSSSRLSEFFSRFDGPFQSRITYVGSAEEADLARAGPLGYTGRTVLRVTSDYSGRLYLRGSSLAVYEGGVWKALPGEAWREYDQSQGGHAVFPLFFPAVRAARLEALQGESGPKYTVTVDNVGAVGSCVYAPYFPALQDLEEKGMSPVEDSLLARRRGQWVHTLDFVDPEPPGGWIVWAQTTVWPGPGWGAADSAEIDDYRKFVSRHYFEVPEEYREELARMCMDNGIYGIFPFYGTLSSGASYQSDPIGTAQQIAALLDQMCVYDPETPAAPAGVDPVYYFLTESRRGYCMHFASAAALMLRSMGIPARYVSGFTADIVPDQQTAVPDRAAHAWVEVWVDGFGWYPVEVTPPAAFTWYEQGTLSTEDAPSDPLPESREPEPTPTPSQSPVTSEQPGAAQGEEAGPEDGPGQTARLGLLKALAAAAGAAALLWLGQYLPKKIRAKRLNAHDHNRAALDGYGYLRRMERWGGQVDQRAVELAQKARFSQHILTRDELDELRACVDAQRERLCTGLSPGLRLAFRYFWGRPVRPKTGKNLGNDRESKG